MLSTGHPVMRAALSTLAVFACLSAPTAALAQAAATAPQPAASSADKPMLVAPGMLKDASPEDVARAQKLGTDIATRMLEAYQQRVTPEVIEDLQRKRAYFDDIADAALAADRKKIVEFLGINPDAATGLYVFVSWSMPLELLRSYAIEAMWSGGTLVFKGVPPGKELGTFITQDLRQLVYGKGASANLSIDPRLFDAYNVKAVPAIVFAKVKSDFQCQGINTVKYMYDKQELSYDTCPELDPSLFYKMSGTVSLNYALQQFIDDGGKEAQPYLSALAKGWVNGSTPGKSQTPFQGKWEDVMSPDQKKAAQDAARMLQPTDTTKR